MTVSSRELSAFSAHLRQEDRSSGTTGKYLHDCTGFALWLGDRELTPEAAAQWREHLLQKGYAPATVNSMLSAVNRLLKFLGREECRVRSLRIQRRTFREQSRELTRGEYQRLLDAAAGLGRERPGRDGRKYG